jgi:hypothetical protein
LAGSPVIARPLLARALSDKPKDPFDGAPLGEEMRRMQEQLSSSPDMMMNIMKSPEMVVRFAFVCLCSVVFTPVHTGPT